jgi:septum site-determining protein MinC
MTAIPRPSHSFKFRGRSFHALVVRPEIPINGWLAEVDAWLYGAPTFFSRKPVVVDIAALSITQVTFGMLVEELRKRDIRVLAVEGADPSWVDDGVPRLNSDPRQTALDEPPIQPLPPALSAASLLIETPVRSGQSIVHSEGDVTIVGSVASGAEVIAAGSVHVYGTVRGRILAGAYGNRSARIFCRRLEAELMAIDGHYSLADEIESHLRKAPICAWLERDALRIMTID